MMKTKPATDLSVVPSPESAFPYRWPMAQTMIWQQRQMSTTAAYTTACEERCSTSGTVLAAQIKQQFINTRMPNCTQECRAEGSSHYLTPLSPQLDITQSLWCTASRPRSGSSRTHRSTWLFWRSTRSTSSNSRRFYDSTWLGWFPIDLVDLLLLAYCMVIDTKKICVQAPSSKRKAYWPSFPFLLPPLNIFIVGSRDHKMHDVSAACSQITYGLLLNYSSVTVDE